MTDQPAPQDLAAEQSALGAMMLRPDAIPAVSDLVGQDDFYRHAHATIYSAILDLVGRGEPADPVTVAAELERRGELHRLGGAPYLHTLIANVPTAANAGYYAEIVADAANRRRVIEAATRLAQRAGDPGRDLAATADAARAELADSSKRNTPSLLDGVRSGAWLDAQQFPDLRYVVQDIFPEGTALLVGPPKVGKSWLVLGIALAAASGGTALGCLNVGTARPVLYLALEDGHRRLQKRCRSLLGPVSIPANLNMLIRIEPGRHLATIAEWLTHHHDNAPLIIVDTLARVMPSSQSGETTYQRDYRAVGDLQALVSNLPGAAMLIVHHTRKLEAADYVDSVSGTQGIAGAADTTVVLSRARTESTGLLRVTGRDIPEAEYGVGMAPGGAWTLTGGSLDAARNAAIEGKATANLGDRSTEIYDIVAAAAPDGIAPAAVAEKLGIAGKDAGQYLGRLVKSERLVKSSRGVYRTPPTPPNTTLSTHTTGVEDTPEAEDDPESGVESVASVETADRLAAQRNPAA